MKVAIGLILILLSHVPSWSQQIGANWVFAKKNQLTFSELGNVSSSGGRAINVFASDGQSEGPSSISDSTGQLLFYSDGKRLWDWNDSLITDQLMGHPSSTHASYIVPKPGETATYYLFTTDALQNNYENGLRYSIITACRQEGVIIEEMNVFLAGPMSEKICAIAHSNGSDYWLLTHELNTSVFLIYAVTSNGILLHSQQELGLNHDTQLGAGVGVGAIKASPDGKHIVVNLTNHLNKSDIMQFDPSLGFLSHRFSIDMMSLGYGYGIAQPYGASFSPDNSKLYISGTIWYQVAQFSMNQTIQTEQEFIDNMVIVHVDSMSNGATVSSFQHLQLGIDGKIYCVNIGSKKLAVIHNPNESGLLCNFEDSAITLSHRADHGLPAFIDSYHYTASGFCNSGVGINAPDQTKPPHLQTTPNPFTHYTDINYNHASCSSCQLVVSDMLGRTVKTLNTVGAKGTVRVYAAELGVGVYFYSLVKDGQVLKTEKMVVE